MKVRVNKVENEDFKFLEGHEFEVVKKSAYSYFFSDLIFANIPDCTVISDTITKTVAHVQPTGQKRPKPEDFIIKGNINCPEPERLINCRGSAGVYYDGTAYRLALMKFEKRSAHVEEVNKSEHIPFDLEKWNTGKYDVVQRNGVIIESLTRNDLLGQPLFGVDTKSELIICWSLCGNYFITNAQSDRDLFLIPKIEIVWVNVWHTFLDSKLESEIDSKKNKFNSRFVKTIEIKKPIE